MRARAEQGTGARAPACLRAPASRSCCCQRRGTCLWEQRDAIAPGQGEHHRRGNGARRGRGEKRVCVCFLSSCAARHARLLPSRDARDGNVAQHSPRRREPALFQPIQLPQGLPAAHGGRHRLSERFCSEAGQCGAAQGVEACGVSSAFSHSSSLASRSASNVGRFWFWKTSRILRRRYASKRRVAGLSGCFASKPSVAKL